MAYVLGVSVLAIAGTTVAEYVTGWNLGIDQGGIIRDELADFFPERRDRRAEAVAS